MRGCRIVRYISDGSSCERRISICFVISRCMMGTDRVSTCVESEHGRTLTLSSHRMLGVWNEL